MVKIPSFDELKKMGSGLIDSAKTVKFTEVVDKLKSGLDSVSGKKAPTEEVSDVGLQALFKNMYSALNELTTAQATQLRAIKKIEQQLEALAKAIEKDKSEEKKPHE